MKANSMETSSTSEMVSQNTSCGQILGTKNREFPEIAKNVLWASNNDKEHDKNQSNEGIAEIEQPGKNLIKAREACFNSITEYGMNKAHSKMYSEGGSQTSAREKGP